MGLRTASSIPVQMDDCRLLMVVPTYNEIGNIPVLVEQLEDVRKNLCFDVLVVDDNSPDGTATAVTALGADRPWLHLLQRDRPTGLGSAYRAGFRWGLTHSYEYIGEMDADLSHDPMAVPQLYDEVSQGVDLAVGSRYVPGGRTVGWPLRRKALSWSANTFARRVLRLRQRDVTAGFRVYRRPAAQLIVDGAQCEGYGFQVEGTYLVTRNDMTIREVPITFRERTVGGSKMSRDTAVEAARRCLALALWAQPHAPDIAIERAPAGVAAKSA